MIHVGGAVIPLLWRDDVKDRSSTQGNWWYLAS